MDVIYVGAFAVMLVVTLGLVQFCRALGRGDGV